MRAIIAVFALAAGYLAGDRLDSPQWIGAGAIVATTRGHRSVAEPILVDGMTPGQVFRRCPIRCRMRSGSIYGRLDATYPRRTDPYE